MANAQTSRLMALPTELRLSILEFTLLDTSYMHMVESDFWVRASEEEFDRLRLKVGIIWVNSELRAEALPILRKNLTLDLHQSDDGYPVPLLIRQNATKFKTCDYAHDNHVMTTMIMEREGGFSAVEYLELLRKQFPRIQNVEISLHHNHYRDWAVEGQDNLLKALKGGFEEEDIDDLFGRLGLEGSLPADDLSKCTVTIYVTQDWEYQDERDERTFNLQFQPYRMKVNAFTREVIERHVNIFDAEVHRRGLVWVDPRDCYLLTKGVSWPVLYHVPSGKMRTFSRNKKYIKKVKKELGRGRNWAKALEAAQSLR